MRIDLGALRFDGTADTDGSRWWVETIDGWDSPDDSLDTMTPSGRHGEVLASHLYRGRSLVLAGACIATSEANMWKSHNKLAALVGLTSASTLSVYETVTKSVDVIRAGKPNLLVKSPTAFRWQLSLRALNPFKRGASHSQTIAASGSATITYGGTAQGFPTATLTGSGTVDLANSTTSTRVQCSSLASGAVIDNYARTVYAGTTNQFSTVAPGVAWITLLPGSNSVTNSGTAGLSLSWNDLYL